MATISTKSDVFYPESDGKPMAETRTHREAMTDLIAGLEDWFNADPLAYVSGNDFVYWVEGQPRSNVSPDVYCVRGVDKSVLRRVYKTWLEGGKGPDLVVEATSKSTRREDQGKKLRIYRDELKVREYFLFDPLAEYLKPPLQGHRLVDGEYRPIEPVAGRLPSEVLGLHLEAEGPVVRLFDPATGRRLLNGVEKLEVEKAARKEANTKLQASKTQLRQKDAILRAQDAAIRTQEVTIRTQNDAIGDQEAAILAQATAIEAKNAALRELQGEVERLRRENEALQAASKPKRK